MPESPPHIHDQVAEHMRLTRECQQLGARSIALRQLGKLAEADVVQEQAKEVMRKMIDIERKLAQPAGS